MSAVPQPDGSTLPDPATPGAGQPPATPPPDAAPPAPSEKTVAATDRFYAAYPLSRANRQNLGIGERAAGIVVVNGRKSASFPPGSYAVDDLLPSGVPSGTLYVVRTGSMIVHLPVITVQSLDRWDIDVELVCAVQVISPAELIDERDPEEKLDLVLSSAARSAFGHYTIDELSDSGKTGVDMDALLQGIRDTCERDFQAGRGVAGLRIQRIDFDAPWEIVDEEALKARPAPAAEPAPPPDDAQLVDLLAKNPPLLNEVAAAFLSELTTLSVLPPDRRRFTAIQDAQGLLDTGQRRRLRELIHNALQGLGEGAGNGSS
ncbi:MAG: SPFH domain-containing protein [Anaerolineae bacterium]